MKYNLDTELKFFSIFSGSMVGRLYPLLNACYRLKKCRPDNLVSVKEHTIPGYRDESISTLVIEPKQYSGNIPCVMLFHGGGFLMSASGAHYRIAKWYAQRGTCKVILPDYRLLPRYRYPVAIEDCYSTYLWVLKNAGTLDIDTDRIIITGDSAGGNIAGAVTAMLYDRGFPLPKGMMLIYPVLDRRMDTGSMNRFTDTPIWDSRCTKMLWDMYLDGQDADRAKYASIAEIDPAGRFPETYVEVAEYDCLHDEGIAFAERLRAEGIPVEVHEVKGTCHGYESALKSSIVGTCMSRRIDWIKRILMG